MHDPTAIPRSASSEARLLLEPVPSEKTNLASLDAGTLKRLSSERGIDYATALLYQSICDSDQHGPMIRVIEKGDVSTISDAPLLVIVPGAFHQHHEHTGADGLRVVQAAGEMGWAVETVDVGSFSPVANNAEAIIAHLRRHSGRSIVLVSLSKGSADVVAAMQHVEAHQAFASVNGWLDLSGLVFGTPLVQWLSRRPWRVASVSMILWSRRMRYATVREMRYQPDTKDCEPLRSIRTIHVRGFPLRRHLRHPWAARGYDRLASLGPNDGGGILLADASRLPGMIYPAWGVDHYLNPAWNFSPVLRSLLAAVASRGAAIDTPAAISTA